ncbi:HNH endonuclease [Streptomyces phage Forrest]|uniref:HNH endonuclease n=1 Tax=Streptomyces phage MeganTheeKilla TaxID=2801897 RepID=A0A7U0J7D2_9CAUD|nr:HNH endonuclease [Streptomyces phage MeganTheeKilla]QZE11198.1 HNH endonuclease [Streptomyces phage Forrest]QZE11425.1 HNH endonuclease [Streptomyces phage Jada]
MFEFSEEYKRYIGSDRWKLVCARYWTTFGRKCQACGSRKNLHVHHNTYERFGRERLSDLTGVCQSCHKAIHAIHRRDRRKSLRSVTLSFVNKKRLSRL